jgi:hypothetical protein
MSWANSKEFKHKRKMIVRDWFFYVIWYQRLRKVFSHMYHSDLLEYELEKNEKYQQIVALLEKKNATLADIQKLLTIEKAETMPQESFQETESTFSLKSSEIRLQIYSDLIPKSKHPELVLEAKGLNAFYQDKSNAITTKVAVSSIQLSACECLDSQLESEQITP